MEITSAFLESWNRYMYFGTAACVGIALLLLVFHEVRIFQLKDYKAKYDYVNLHEVRYFWYSVIAFVLAAAFFGNTLGSDAIQGEGNRGFYVRLFIAASFVIIAYFVFFGLVRIYYPRYVEKRLTRFRNTPRISPAGNIMRKLAESEEEHHLEPAQKHDGKVHSIDYDIWLDEKTGFKKVEKYSAYQHAEECSECGYFTMKIKSEDIEKEPTPSNEGLLLKHYSCSYCGHREQREIVVARLSTNIA
jgi:ribosomal protein L32